MLSDEYAPYECSVDPVTGNLAVVSGYGGESRIAIYPDAQGTPSYYSDSGMSTFEYCAYDDSGNLFVDGTNGLDPPHLAELAYGGSSFTNITLNGQLSHYPATLQWVGDYLAMSVGRAVYHVRVSGSTGTIVGKTRLKKGFLNPWAINSNRLITLYRADTKINGAYEVAYWKYPKGGTSTAVLNVFGSASKLDGVALSLGSSTLDSLNGRP